MAANHHGPKKSRPSRASFHVGRVTCYLRNRTWWIYYRENGTTRRVSIGPDKTQAERQAAEINALLCYGMGSSFGFSKGAKDRLVFFDPRTRSEIEKYLKFARRRLARPEERALVVGDDGRRMDRHSIRAIVKKHAGLAGIDKPIAAHSLRRTFCTLLLRAGANLKVIAELAGHASLKTTVRYTKVEISELSAVYRATHPRGRA